MNCWKKCQMTMKGFGSQVPHDVFPITLAGSCPYPAGNFFRHWLRFRLSLNWSRPGPCDCALLCFVPASPLSWCPSTVINPGCLLKDFHFLLVYDQGIFDLPFPAFDPAQEESVLLFGCLALCPVHRRFVCRGLRHPG